MTASTSTHPHPRKPSARPSVARLLAAKYVDLLVAGFISWTLCFTFGWQEHWTTLAIILWVGEWFWCRDRLNPTLGEYFLGIRYLTSSSSQVVADIQIIHSKLKLNGYLLFAGVMELTLAILFFCGWTFLGKAAWMGRLWGAPLSLGYWILMGFLYFTCASYLLSGSKRSLWAVPLVHCGACLELLLSYPAWRRFLQEELVLPEWVHGPLVLMVRSQSFLFLDLFVVWTFLLAGVLVLSRKHLVNG